MKVVVKQDAAAPVAAEIMADAIIEISKATEKMLGAGLRRTAIVALIHDQSGVNKSTINIVINNLLDLRKDWCTK